MERDRQLGLTMEPTGAEQAPPSNQRPDVGSPSRLVIQRYRKVVLPVLLAVIFSSLAFFYLYSIFPKLDGFFSFVWVGADRQEDASSHPGLPVVSLPPDDLAGIPADFVKELTERSSVSHVEFSRNFRRPIDKVCDYLGSLGLGEFTAMHNPVADGQWICSSDILPAGDMSASPNVSSIFVWMRGAERGEIDLVRLKVNLTDPASSDAAKSLAVDLLEKLHAALDWDMPRALKDAVRDVKDASFDRYGTSYQITREWSSLPRLNVVIRTNDRSGIVPADAFSFSAGDAPRKRPAPGPAKLQKPSHASPAKPDAEARFETGPIENLMQ